jgi:DNA ligase-1
VSGACGKHSGRNPSDPLSLLKPSHRSGRTNLHYNQAACTDLCRCLCPQAKLRIGLAEQSVLVALAHAVHLHRDGVKDKDGRLAEKLEAAAQVVKQAYSECPSYDVVSAYGWKYHAAPAACLANLPVLNRSRPAAVMMLCSQLIPALLENGTTDLMSRCHFMPGVPVKPMLAKVGGAAV